ncbi:MAG: hypothetical protein ACOH2A_11065 [Sphingobacteriaceae bacterium]
MQYFTGERTFRYKSRCDPSEFVHFRNRIGTEWVEKIVVFSVKAHGELAFSKMALQNTTVQENTTTSPTNAKRAKKIIDKCNRIANEEEVLQCQTYVLVSKQLVRSS